MKLLSVSNTKTRKGEAQGYLTFILHLAPGKLSGFQVCPGASKGCLSACLNTAGRGRFNPVQDARVRKTRKLFEDRAGFMGELVGDIESAERKANRGGMVPVFRLNGTSDIRWETIPCTRDGERFPNVMEAFPHLTFYDYTKLPNRRNIPANYHLTFSRSESNENRLAGVVRRGLNVAVVFAGDLPETYRGLPVVSGDDTDLRFLDPKGCIVGLTAKGEAKGDTSGFVVGG